MRLKLAKLSLRLKGLTFSKNFAIIEKLLEIGGDLPVAGVAVLRPVLRRRFEKPQNWSRFTRGWQIGRSVAKLKEKFRIHAYLKVQT